MYLQMAFKQRPLRDGGGKPSLGRLAPWTRPLSKAAAMGAKIFVLTSSWGDKLQESLSLEDLLEDIREILAPGAGRPAEGQPFFLDILHSLALNIQDPDHQFPRDLEQGFPLRVTDPPLALPGIWPLKKELSGEEPEFQELPHPTGRGNYPSADHFSELIRSTFLEEVPMGMVDGPLTKVEAAARCGCNMEDLCPGPLAGIDEGTRSAPSTMARWAGPMTPSGTRRWKGRRLRRCWMGCKLFIGYMRQLRRDLPLRCPWPREGGR